MSLREKLNAEIKNAMINKNKERLSALRLLLAEVKKIEVESSDRSQMLADDQVISIASKMIKERKDSAAQYRSAGRDELASAEEAEIAVISEFLPEQLTAEELNKILIETINEVGATTAKDMGKVMSAIKPKVQGKTDMGALSGLVKAQLNK